MACRVNFITGGFEEQLFKPNRCSNFYQYKEPYSGSFVLKDSRLRSVAGAKEGKICK